MPFMVRPSMDGAEHSIVRVQDERSKSRQFKEIDVLHNNVMRPVSLRGCFALGIPIPNELLDDLPYSVQIFPTETKKYSNYTAEGTYGAPIVSSKFLDLLNSIEPNRHQSLAINRSVNENWQQISRPYHFLNVDRSAVPTVDLSNSDVEVKEYHNVKIYAVKEGVGPVPRIAMFNDAIKSRHLWRNSISELGGEFFALMCFIVFGGKEI